MHSFEGYEISKEELINLAEKMKADRYKLLIINGYIDKEGRKVVAYNFDINGNIKTYLLRGYDSLPTLTKVYKGAAQWCEEEIEEMMPIKFDGLERSGRLFLPDDFNGEGQILVLPIAEIKNMNRDNFLKE